MIRKKNLVLFMFSLIVLFWKIILMGGVTFYTCHFYKFFAAFVPNHFFFRCLFPFARNCDRVFCSHLWRIAFIPADCLFFCDFLPILIFMPHNKILSTGKLNSYNGGSIISFFTSFEPAPEGNTLLGLS